MLPSAEEIIKIMKEDFDINITESNTVKIDVNDILTRNFNLSDINITIPTLKIDNLFPGINIDELSDVNLTTNIPDSPFNGMNLKDFVDGDLNINLE